MLEGFKNSIAFVFRDTDTGVAHAKTQLYSALLHVLKPDLDFDFAHGGEFDGIADEVKDDLAYAQRVADHVVGHRGIDRPDQLQAFFMRTHRQHTDGLLQAVAQAEGDRFNLEFAGLDLRQVKNIVDDMQQCFRGRFDGAQAVALFGIQRGAECELGHADDAVHRGAYFVAHIGEKFALRECRRLGCFLGAAQFFLRVFEHGRIVRDGDVADEFAAIVSQWAARSDHVHTTAAFSRPPVTDHESAAGSQAGQPFLPFFFRCIFEQDVAHRTANYLFLAKTEYGFCAVIPGCDHAVHVAGDDGVARLFNHPCEHARA